MAGEVKSYEDLGVWQMAMRLAEIVYQLSKQLPTEERYGLVSQLNRAAFSVPANIAEGSERGGTKELIQFLYIAKGSLAETETHLKLASRLKLIDPVDEALQISDQLSRGLSNLIKSLKRSS